jgi:hypothetical protein
MLDLMTFLKKNFRKSNDLLSWEQLTNRLTAEVEAPGTCFRVMLSGIAKLAPRSRLASCIRRNYQILEKSAPN